MGLEGVPVFRGVMAAIRQDVARREGHDEARLDRGSALVARLGFEGYGCHVLSLHDVLPGLPPSDHRDILGGNPVLGGEIPWSLPRIVPSPDLSDIGFGQLS